MRTRKHHNNKGYRQIKEGRTVRQVECMAKRLGVGLTIKEIIRKRIDGGRCIFCGTLIASRRPEYWTFIKYNNENILVCDYHPGLELCKN
jgi:hypothetical protein